MKSQRLEEDKHLGESIIKDVRNLFNLRKLKNKKLMLQLNV